MQERKPFSGARWACRTRTVAAEEVASHRNWVLAKIPMIEYSSGDSARMLSFNDLEKITADAGLEKSLTA